MELPDVVNTIIGYIPKIDYSVTNDSVSLFETTIRYLGGMLAGGWPVQKIDPLNLAYF